MGVNCRVFARFENGIYFTTRLELVDSFHIFGNYIKDHDELFVGYDKGRIDSEYHYCKFPVQHGINWCQKRLQIISEMTEEECLMDCIEVKEYWISCINFLLEFLFIIEAKRALIKENIKWVALLHEKENLYQHIMFIKRRNKEQVIEFDI